MKKSLVALAVLGAFAGAASAQSSVTIYGALDIGYGKIKGAATQFGMNNGEAAPDGFNTTSVIGFRGTEDLGGGMTANFNLQSGGLDLSTGATGLAFSREANIGFAGGFGSVQLGRASSVAAKTMGGFDLNGTSASSALATAGVSAVTWYGSSRRSSQLQYATPNMGGFTGRLGVTMKGDGAAADKTRTTLGLSYANGPLAVAAVTESAQTAADRSAFAMGASYDLGVAKLGATYNKNTSVAAGKGITLSANVPMGAANFGIQYARNTEAATKPKAVELYANYALSKRTRLYIDYGNQTFAAPAPSTSAYGFGVVHTF